MQRQCNIILLKERTIELSYLLQGEKERPWKSRGGQLIRKRRFPIPPTYTHVYFNSFLQSNCVYTTTHKPKTTTAVLLYFSGIYEILSQLSSINFIIMVCSPFGRLLVGRCFELWLVFIFFFYTGSFYESSGNNNGHHHPHKGRRRRR